MLIGKGSRINIEISFKKDENLSYLDKGTRIGSFMIACKDGRSIVLPSGAIFNFDDGDRKTLSISPGTGIFKGFDTDSIGSRITVKIWGTESGEDGCDELIFANKEMKLFVGDTEVASYNGVTVALQEPKYFDKTVMEEE